jgi:protein ImuA
VQAAIEEGLRSPGLAGVVAETTARITLTASQRLHLAAEAAGTPGFLLRRSRSVLSAPLWPVFNSSAVV